jgi:hypothetical protein
VKTNSKLGLLLAMCALFWATQYADAAQGNWNLVTKGASGPQVFVHVASSGNVNMLVLVAFEYERQCDAIFSYMEFASPIGAPLGAAIRKYRIDNSNLGVVHNGYFYTWHAAKVEYPHGFEVGFGITRELWQALTGSTTSLAYVREDGAQFNLPISGLREKLLQGLNYCRSRI